MSTPMKSECHEDDGLVRKAFRLKEGTDPREIETLPHILTLMMMKDAILSSVRWQNSLVDTSCGTGLVDLTFCVICRAGWASEAILLLKDLKKKNIITDATRCMLPDASSVDLKDVLDECIAENPSSVIRRIHSIRNAGFAHFHNHGKSTPQKEYKLACQLIDNLANDKIDVPLMEWTERSGEARNIDSAGTAGIVAIIDHMYGVSRSEPLEFRRAVAEYSMKVGILLDRLIDVMCREAGIEFEPYDATSEP